MSVKMKLSDLIKIGDEIWRVGPEGWGTIGQKNPFSFYIDGPYKVRKFGAVDDELCMFVFEDEYDEDDDKNMHFLLENINSDNFFAVYTNKEDALQFAKEWITNDIKKIENEINQLQSADNTGSDNELGKELFVLEDYWWRSPQNNNISDIYLESRGFVRDIDEKHFYVVPEGMNTEANEYNSVKEFVASRAYKQYYMFPLEQKDKIWFTTKHKALKVILEYRKQDLEELTESKANMFSKGSAFIKL